MVPTPSGGGEKMRLVDDAFAKICHAINDPCVQVRVLAATLLGKMPQVGQNFLDQTLDKKLMSDMRRKRSAHERQWEKVKSGEWSSGKKWADDAPQELIEAASVSLISSGAAGAFVHGLEDEFLEVRSAAVDSLCTLAIKSPDFANLALDFLVDMFNDEIEDVRLKAIDSLTKISKYIVLWEDQLETILAVLEDSSIDIREGLHKLLAVCHLMTKDCVKMCLDHILENLKRYPQDKKSIWKSLEGVGKNHPWVVLPLVPQLLSMHPFFDTSEPDPEDPAYVSVLILVFNSAKGCPTMATLFDEKLLRHYHYLRDTLPHFVPELNISNESITGTSDKQIASSSSGSGTSIGGNTNGRLILKELTAKLKSSSNLNSEMKTRLCKLILKDLKRLSEVDQEISAIAKFSSLYIKAQLVYTNCLSSSAWIQLTQNTQNEPLRLQIQSFMQLCLKMQYGFTGLSPKEYGIVMQLKLRALAFQLVYIVRGSNASALAICQNLLEQAETVQKYLEENNLTPDEFTFAMLKMLDSLDEPKPGTVAKHLLPLFEAHQIPLISFSSSIKMASATIIEPTGESDNALKFTAGLLLGIPVDAEIHNLEDTSYVRIMINYPDQQVHLICPRAQDFRSDSNGEVRLLTTISISHQAWTEACPVTISIVLDLRGPETNYNRKLMWKKDSTYIIQLSEEKQVLVSPKPAKRGI
ncbi:Integrator complex subunit 4 [Orchesella cincta]|uniref:Integrator complex subunit 4 n=1 Tax=Orchesella cincta TaxID=48709 RepID=A0A1D2N3C4_ORCCI|nr:Integrator complex subunit 4 [Orchesella cincta]